MPADGKSARAAYAAQLAAKLPSELSHAEKTRSALVGTGSAAHGILKVSYSHDAMIDLLLAEPGIKQKQIAEHFGVTGPWVSRVVNSDAFLARLAERKAQLIDPLIIFNMEEKLKGVMEQSLDIVAEKLDASRSPDLALRTLELSTKALGYGARDKSTPVVNNFVVALPPKADTPSNWAAQYGPGVSEAVVVAQKGLPSPDKNPDSDLARLAAAVGAI